VAVTTEKQGQFCRHYVANGGNASAAAKEAGYSDPGQEGYRLLRKRHIRLEIERLQAAIAKAGNRLMARALADSSEKLATEPPIEPNLARALAKRRGADDELRAVMSQAYVMAGLADALEMALGRKPIVVTRMRKIKRTEGEGDDKRTIEETETQTLEILQTDLAAANSAAANLAKILLPEGDKGPETIEAMTEARKKFMDELLYAVRNRKPPPPMLIEPKRT
jgi:hypothetical protein